MGEWQKVNGNGIHAAVIGAETQPRARAHCYRRRLVCVGVWRVKPLVNVVRRRCAQGASANGMVEGRPERTLCENVQVHIGKLWQRMVMEVV